MEKNKESIETEEEAKALTMLEQTTAAIEELKAANAEKKALLDREEKIIAARMLSGKANAGTPDKPKGETPKEYADKILKGQKP